ncbi:hypothetical protein Tco_1009458 [Tanacetum coccineum]
MALRLYCTFNGSKRRVKCNFLMTKLPMSSVVGRLPLTEALAELKFVVGSHHYAVLLDNELLDVKNTTHKRHAHVL